MFVRHRVALAAPLALLLAPQASAEKLSKESKNWLEEEVAPIITASEEKFFKEMKESDRAEFKKIFWSRRDTGVDVPKPENDFKAEYLEKKAEADRKFRVSGRPGSLTGCGRTYILLGPPDETRPAERGAEPPAPGARNPEIWIYNEKATLPFRIKEGSMEVAFGDSCEFPPGSRFGEQLKRIADARIARPGLEYRLGKDGRLIKLVDMLPKPTPAQLLLKEPRQDFPSGAEVQFLKTADGGTALVGLIHGKAEGLTTTTWKVPGTVDVTVRRQSEDTTRVGVKEVPAHAVKLVVAAQATDESGRVAATYEQATLAPVAEDGTFAASYRLGLKPGQYSLRVVALDEASKKGSVAEKATDVPDLNTGELSVASLIAVREIEENASSDAAHPFSAYLLGTARLVPFPGRTFSKSDALNIFYQYYDAKQDEATGKASVVASLQILKADKPLARAPDQPFDMQVGGNIVGPVPLEKYEAGGYTVRLKITDNIAKKDVTQELAFEVR